MKMIKFDESEYEKYANIINDKVYCEQLTNKRYSLLIFMKIWGIRQGSINYAKCKKFIKVLKRADKKSAHTEKEIRDKEICYRK